MKGIWLVCLLPAIWALLPSCSTVPETVKIAFVGPLTGPNAAVGMGARNAFELRVEEMLAAGDFPYQVEVLYLDDESDPLKGVQLALELCADKAVIGAATHWNSAVALATGTVFHECGMAQVLWGTVHRDIIYSNDYDNNFRVLPTSLQLNQMAAERAVQDFGRMRWAIIHDDTINGKNNASEFYEALTWQGGQVVGFFKVELGQVDFSEVLAGVQPHLPEGIYYGGEAVEGGLLRKQSYEMGITKVLFLGPPGIQSAAFGEYAGEAAEGAFCAGTVDPHATMWGRTFVETYNTLYSEPYEQNGAYAYDSAEILLEALREAGADREKVIQYITENDFFGAIGEIHWDPYGQNTLGGMVLYIHEDGQWVDYDSSSYAGGFLDLPWE